VSHEVWDVPGRHFEVGRHLRRRRTYPGFFPILHLDHIYYEGSIDVVKVTMPRDRMTLMASDHLPLVADVKITCR